MDDIKLKQKAVEQALDYAKTCIHQQLKLEEFQKVYQSIFNYYKGQEDGKDKRQVH